MSDVEKARKMMREMMHRSHPGAAVYQLAMDALRALDGEAGEEVWEASGKNVSCPGGYLIATCDDEPTAHRIARLPKLERTAAAAERYLDGWAIESERHARILADLSAALTDKPEV